MTFNNEMEYDSWLNYEIMKRSTKKYLSPDMEKLGLPIQTVHALARVGIVKVEQIKNIMNGHSVTVIDRGGDERTFDGPDSLKHMKRIGDKTIIKLKELLIDKQL